MSSAFRTGVALVGAALLTGCFSSYRPPTTSADELAAIKQRLVEAERRAVVGEVEMQRLQNELKTAKASLAAAQDELARRQRTEPVRDGIDAKNLGLGRSRVDETELTEPQQVIETPAEPVSIPTTPIDLAQLPADPQALYDQAYTLFHQKRYQDAERFFATFLERHSNSDLADNALFWVGESRFARGELQQALMAFLETVERFPTGNKVADALLKAGKCLEGLGRKRDAIATYEEIGQRFPGSAAALTADERLTVLRLPDP